MYIPNIRFPQGTTKMMYLPLEARLALEWLNASGERTPERLRSLVEHFCTTNAITDTETRTAIYEAAKGSLTQH
jgi:hypothetical protein